MSKFSGYPPGLSRLDRRRFLKASAISAGTFLLGAPAFLLGKGLNDKLNIAIIGAGGRGAANTQSVSSENIVALCDVSEDNLNKAAVKFPKARKRVDFRKLCDEANDIDAVVVSTAEHTHAFATLPALRLGKHVYCEKPLTHCIWEARFIVEAAKRAKVATQMGTQMHATDNFRRVDALRELRMTNDSKIHTKEFGDRPAGAGSSARRLCLTSVLGIE